MGLALPKITVACSVVSETARGVSQKVVATKLVPFPWGLNSSVLEAQEAVSDVAAVAANDQLPHLVTITKRDSTKEASDGTGSNKRKTLAVDLVGLGAHWVLIAKVIEYTGYTDDAVRAKKQRGEWKEGIHWRKGPDNRLLFNLVAIQKWMGGQYA